MRRRKHDRPSADSSPTTAATAATAETAGDGVAPSLGRVRPDDSVLDELSRVFGATGGADDSGDPSAGSNGTTADAPGTGDDGAADDTARTEPDPLASALGAPDRQTISIGGDDLGLGIVDPIPLDEALGRPGSLGARGTAGGADTTSGPVRSTIPIGGADDLPDARYLDEELVDGESAAATVFIDDDGTGDALAPKDATAPGIEPRFRQRRIGVRRAEGRRRLKWVVIGGAVVVVLLAVLTLLGSGLFAIDEISVGGNVYTDENRLEAVIEDLRGTPVLLADTDRAEADLEAIPWVEDARVRAHLPNRATIEIRERTPVATMRGADGRFRVIDADGRVLDVIEGQPVAYVLIAGQGTLDLAAGEFAPIGPSAAAALVTKLTPTLRPRVESIEVADDGSDLVVNLAPLPDGVQTATIRVRFGSALGDNDQIEKLVRLEQKLDDLPTRPITEINVATNEVTVR